MWWQDRRDTCEVTVQKRQQGMEEEGGTCFTLESQSGMKLVWTRGWLSEQMPTARTPKYTRRERNRFQGLRGETDGLKSIPKVFWRAS